MYPAIPGSPSPVAQAPQQQQQQPSAPPMQQQPCDAPVGDVGSLETVFKAGIARPEDLPAVVSAAQACLLNGSRVASDHNKRAALHTVSFGHSSPSPGDAGMGLRTVEAGQHAGLKFSRDVVIVEVSGAPVDLTLIDLPGGQPCSTCSSSLAMAQQSL